MACKGRSRKAIFLLKFPLEPRAHSCHAITPRPIRHWSQLKPRGVAQTRPQANWKHVFSSFFTVREPPGSRSFVGRDKEGVSYPHWPLLRSTPPLTPCYGPCPVVLEVLECALELKSLVFRCAETAVTLPVGHAQFEVSQRSCANIVGAIDGSHVRIKVPSESTADYFSRYQQHEFYFILS